MMPTAAAAQPPDEFFRDTNLASLKLVSWNPGMRQKKGAQLIVYLKQLLEQHENHQEHR